MRKNIILTVFVSMLSLSSMIGMQFTAPVKAGTTWTAMIDLYTQKGGKGPNTPSDSFMPEEKVILYANVTYNSAPVCAKIVAFEVHGPPNPIENLTLIKTAMTNASGIATTNFRIPGLDENLETIVLGTWTVYASVKIAEEKVEETLTFIDDFSVGGIYLPINKLELLAPYIGLTTLLIVAVVAVGYVKKRKQRLTLKQTIKEPVKCV